MMIKRALDQLGKLWLIPTSIGMLLSCALFIWSIGSFASTPTFASYLFGLALIVGLTLITLAVANPFRRTSAAGGRDPSIGDILFTWLTALGLALLLGMVGGLAFALFQRLVAGQYIKPYEWGYFLTWYAMIMIAADFVALAVGTILIVANKLKTIRRAP